MIEEQLTDHVDLIVDATFHGDDAPDLLRRWQVDYGVEILCVICDLDPEQRRTRIETRSRHPAHADADARQLLALDDVADYSRLPGAHLHLRMDRPLDLGVQSVLDLVRGAGEGGIARRPGQRPEKWRSQDAGEDSESAAAR